MQRGKRVAKQQKREPERNPGERESEGEREIRCIERQNKRKFWIKSEFS